MSLALQDMAMSEDRAITSQDRASGTVQGYSISGQGYSFTIQSYNITGQGDRFTVQAIVSQYKAIR
jgi:hypothetical protein